MAQRSPTPPVVSKRDKRRSMLSDRINEMVESFGANQYDHYFAQLAASSCDINLIMRADPLHAGPLEDSPEGISRLVDEARKETTRNRPLGPEAEESFSGLKGRQYSQFVNEVNAALEDRDASLTMAYTQYHDSLAELRRTNQYKVQLAHEEHHLLSKTIRERLIQSVTQKKLRLLRDKEQLDIADSSALLLNPNQFSTANPASPGGPQNPRKTRHSRLRPGESDEVIMGAVQENNKRKRKTALEENDHESPASTGRNGDNRVSTPYRDARAKLIHSQYEAPAYSIDRLFTEKELAMNLHRAHAATSEYFARANAQQTLNSSASVNGTTVGSVDTNGTDGTAQHLQEGRDQMDLDAQATSAAPSTSAGQPQGPNSASAHAHHATRSTQRTAPSSNVLDSLANAATALTPFIVVAPLIPIVAATHGSKTIPPHAPPVPGLTDAEVQSDILLMQRGPEDPVIQRLATQATQRHGAELINPLGAWRTPVVDADEGHTVALAAVGDVGLGFGAHGMLRQGSGMSGMTPGVGGLGGFAMSRNTSMMSEGGAAGISTADFGIRTRRMG